MYDQVPRRAFMRNLMGIPLLTPAAALFNNPAYRPDKQAASGNRGLKTSLNAFSYNVPLTSGTMNIEGMLDICASQGFDAIDITGYYFTGYPKVPDDEYLYRIKRKAFNLGLDISGTGVRNDFTIADKEKRQQEVALVKSWIEVAAKLGAPVIRIFAGPQKPEGDARKAMTEWMLKDIADCVEYGKRHGVIIGLQNHNDFIQTADQIVAMVEAIHSEWLGIILDTGSYRVNDPYQEIAKSVKYAVNWQIKENVFLNGAEVETDMPKLMDIIRSSTYRGYLPIETLGQGDPKPKVDALLAKLKKALG